MCVYLVRKEINVGHNGCLHVRALLHTLPTEAQQHRLCHACSRIRLQGSGSSSGCQATGTKAESVGHITVAGMPDVEGSLWKFYHVAPSAANVVD